MPLNIIVCLKAVPDPEHYDAIKIDPVKKTLIRENMPNVINPCDLHALELALTLKESHGGEITVLSMAPGDTKILLKEALAYGADEAYLLSDRKLAGADTLATSYSIARLIAKLGKFDLILTGNSSADGATAHVPSQLGEWLEIPHVTDVVDVTAKNEKCITVRKDMSDCMLEYDIVLPACLGIAREANQVRNLTMKNILTMNRKKLIELSAAALPDLDEQSVGLAGSPTKAGSLMKLSLTRQGKQLTGSEAEIAAKMLAIMKPLMKSSQQEVCQI